MRIKKFFSGVLACALACAASWADAASIDSLRTSVSPARVRVVLDSAEAIAYKEDKSNLRLEIELSQSAAKKQQPKISDASIKSVRLEPVGEKASRLLIEFKKDCQYKIYQLPAPHRLVIDIFRINIVKQSKKLAKGVTYTYLQDEMNGRQIQAYLVEVAPDAAYRVLPFSAAGAYNGRGLVSQQAAAKKMPAAVNASYFDTDGWVVGTVKNQGVMMAADGQPRSGIAWQNGAAAVLEDIGYAGSLRLPGGKELHIKGMNRARIADDLVLYNSFYAPTTKTNSFGREVRLVKNRVTEVSTTGNMKITSDSVVISGHGSNASALAGLRVGDKVQLTETLGSDAADEASVVVSGGPLLLERGRVNVRVQEEKIASDIAKGRAPRTALGVKKDGTVLLVVVDGRNNNSAGLTLQEMATYMLRLGARDAVNFDGGGSSVMAVNGRVVNKPSDGKERRVSIGLGLFTK